MGCEAMLPSHRLGLLCSESWRHRAHHTIATQAKRTWEMGVPLALTTVVLESNVSGLAAPTDSWGALS